MKPTRRFRAMPQSTEQQPVRKPPMSPKVGRDLIAKLLPGKWYSANNLAEDAGITERDVHAVLRAMCWRAQHGAKAERKKVGNQIHYRIFKQDKSVSVEELTTKLRPIVEGLKAEGKKNMATMVPAEVAMLAARLERLLNEWAERSPRRIVGHGKAIHTYVPRSTTNVSAC
jgi:trehalose-6-phosphatase